VLTGELHVVIRCLREYLSGGIKTVGQQILDCERNQHHQH
jgi:hypothetical protein